LLPGFGFEGVFSSFARRFSRRRLMRGPRYAAQGGTMKRKYVAFDIEIARALPEGESDWKAYRPLGISCAAVLPANDEEPLLLHGLTIGRRPAEQMSRQDAVNLVHCLSRMVSGGYTILTWNGLGFDFDILAEESQMLEECSWLALNHVDMMFHAFCELGHPIALDRAAKAMGLSGKPEGMSGALAPRLWATGKYQEVLDYVAQDARTTLELAQTCEERGYLQWIAHSGHIRTMALSKGWLTVREAMALPKPDTSWMSNPLPRSKFTSWIANSSDNIEVSVTLSEANWKAILDILHGFCQRHGEAWVQWGESIGEVIQASIARARSTLPSTGTPIPKYAHEEFGFNCRNSRKHKIVFLLNRKESKYYLCTDCGAVLIVTDWGDVFDSDVSKLTNEVKAKALEVIQSSPVYKERLLKSESPCLFRSRAERGNPYTQEELEEMADWEMGRRLSALMEGEYDYDSDGNPITDPDYYLP